MTEGAGGIEKREGKEVETVDTNISEFERRDIDLNSEGTKLMSNQDSSLLVFWSFS